MSSPRCPFNTPPFFTMIARFIRVCHMMERKTRRDVNKKTPFAVHGTTKGI